MDLEERKRLGKLSRKNNPGYGSCAICERTWNTCDAHYLELNDRDWCFVFCKECNAELTADERLPYYKAVFLEWRSYGQKTFRDNITWDDLDKLATDRVMEGA